MTGCGWDGVESLPPDASSPPQADRQAASSAIAARREANRAEGMEEGTAHVGIGYDAASRWVATIVRMCANGRGAS
ncbi:hypothetical protein GCM10007242_29860 [Pigmentiphaga litoralis]|nr:hypothetical protein GCM10007242_29860 [Pigmentiphaga litoralis]